MSSQLATEDIDERAAEVRARAASFGQQPHQIAKHKSKTGFVGLKNMGCICYMNSTLQQVWVLFIYRACSVCVLALCLESWCLWCL